MRFGPEPTETAEGSVLAHTLRLPSGTLQKGRVLSSADLNVISRAGLPVVTTARLEHLDVDEDKVAREIGSLFGGAGVVAENATGGRVNLRAAHDGLLFFDPLAIERMNLISEEVTVATLEPFAIVSADQIVASIKVIPLAVPEPVMADYMAAAAGEKILVHAFHPLKANMVQTVRPGDKTTLLDKTVAVTAARLKRLNCDLAGEARCPHRVEDIAKAISDVQDSADILLVAGSSAIVDRRDVIPAAIESIGGRIERFGMPADPGNLILIAWLNDKPVLGLPGCARSPARNGLDWILSRLAAGLPPKSADIARMGVGGLLIRS